MTIASAIRKWYIPITHTLNMLTYDFPFLNQHWHQSFEEQRTDNNSGGPVNSPSLPSLDRSTGSPDSLRSETSSDSPDSVTDVLLSLQKQAAIITDVSKVETDKPAHSYIALISMALLSSKGNKMLLGEIYEFIKNKFPYYNNETKAWRNSIRYNLSINECFIRNGRADNGKGNYWSIHPACVEDFAKGDFRRRQARRRARKGIKNVNRTVIPVTDYRGNTGYVPMTSSLFAYQPMTSSPAGYQSMTSSHVGNQPTLSPAVGYPPMKSAVSLYPSYLPLGYHPYQRAQLTPDCPTSTSPLRTYPRYTPPLRPQSCGLSPSPNPLPAGSAELGPW